jgi:hypothetical protein
LPCGHLQANQHVQILSILSYAERALAMSEPTTPFSPIFNLSSTSKPSPMLRNYRTKQVSQSEHPRSESRHVMHSSANHMTLLGEQLHILPTTFLQRLMFPTSVLKGLASMSSTKQMFIPLTCDASINRLQCFHGFRSLCLANVLTKKLCRSHETSHSAYN